MKNVVTLLLLWGITIVACKKDHGDKHNTTRETAESKPRIRKNATAIVQVNIRSYSEVITVHNNSTTGLYPLLFFLKDAGRQSRLTTYPGNMPG